MQKHGLEARGALVERDFGDDGVFVGTVVGFSDEKGAGKLYRVEYSDGDVEDLDQECINQQMVVKHGKRLTKDFLGLRLEELEWIFPMQILR